MTQIIDLSVPIHPGMLTFPSMSHPFVEVTQLGRFEIEGRETRRLTLGTHTGTHVDAPRHFVNRGRTIESVDLSKFYGEALVLDFSGCPDKSAICVDDVLSKLQAELPKRLIFRFDWDKRGNSPAFFTDHPYLTEKLCQWIVDNEICLVGFDSPMPDDPRNGRGSDNDSPNHKILLGAEVVILENLTNLDQIPPQRFTLSALPLKIREGDGSPVRAVAIL